MSGLGQPSASSSALACEQIALPYECVNDTAAPVTKTLQEIIDQAIAGATTNGQTFPSGTAITGADPQNVFAATVCVACNGTPVQLDDGSQFPVTCDAGSVTVAPNGGTNGTAYSCGAEVNLGDPSDNTGDVNPADSITILPGGAATGVIMVNSCTDKSGNPVAV